MMAALGQQALHCMRSPHRQQSLRTRPPHASPRRRSPHLPPSLPRAAQQPRTPGRAQWAQAHSGRARTNAARPPRLCACREGQEVLLNDGRPNGELLLATGTLQDSNLSDCVLMNAGILGADRWEASCGAAVHPQPALALPVLHALGRKSELPACLLAAQPAGLGVRVRAGSGGGRQRACRLGCQGRRCKPPTALRSAPRLLLT
jgi:hypothetical protein